MMEQRVKGDALGDRMKGYEDAYRIALPKRLPVIVRVDGRAFHTATARCKRPFDADLAAAMDHTALALMLELQGACLAYVQSDEISVLLNNYRTLKTEAAFANVLQKLVSISAAIATRAFNAARPECVPPSVFDSRAFVLPEAEVCNYFVWRQKDAMRNAVQMIARSRFSQRECHGKSCDDLRAMLAGAGDPVEAYPPGFRFGRAAQWGPGMGTRHDTGEVVRTGVVLDERVPLFTQDRNYVERHLAMAEETGARAGEAA